MARTSGACDGFPNPCDMCDCFWQAEYADQEREAMRYILAAADLVDPARAELARLRDQLAEAQPNSRYEIPTADLEKFLPGTSQRMLQERLVIGGRPGMSDDPIDEGTLSFVAQAIYDALPFPKLTRSEARALALAAVEALRAPVVPPTDDTTCPNCSNEYHGAKGYCDWCGHRPVPPTEPTSHAHWQHRAGNIVETYSHPGPESICSMCAPTELDEPTKETQ